MVLKKSKMRYFIFKGLIRMIMSSVYIEAGKRIQMVRVMRGLSREELAESASISSKFLYEIENGRKGFSAMILYKICKTLDVDCDYILTGREKVDYDKNLVAVLQLFNQNQTECITSILKQIYKLL